MEIFAKATRVKLRFETPKGLLSVEDLWDLPLKSRQGSANLNDVAVQLHGKLGQQQISFVEQPDPASNNEVEQLAFDVVKFIIDTRLAQAAINLKAVERKEQKARLLDIINRKQNAQLEDTPLEELQAMVEAF